MIQFCKKYLLVGMIPFLLGGCSPLASPAADERIGGSALLSIYLNHEDAAGSRLQIADIALRTNDLWLSINEPTTGGEQSRSNQQLIVLGSVPAAHYDKIRFTVTIVASENTLLRVEQVELPITNRLTVLEADSQCLFIHSTITPQRLNNPLHHLLTVLPQQTPLADNLLYILCPAIKTLYVARSDNFLVCAAYPLPGRVCAMVISNDERLIYLLDQQNQLIQRWDGIAQQSTDRIPLPMTQNPEGLEISNDGRALFVTDTTNRQLLKVDADTGTLLTQVNIGYEPARPYWFEHNRQRRLALLSRGDQQLHVVSADTLNSVVNAPAGQRPHEVIYADGWLYVTDNVDSQLLQLNPDTGGLQTRILTGSAPSALAIDTINRNILIAQHGDKSLALLPFGQQLMARELAAGVDPCDIAISNKQRLVYVANERSNSITVIDLPSEQIINAISVGSTPNVIVVQEQ